MRVLVAGASGTLGRALLPQLAAAGHEIIGITRSPDAAARLEAQGHDALVADVLDRDALLRAVDGTSADAVLHELTALSKAPTHFRSMRATNELRILGTTNLVDAARAVGATRFVTQSIVFGYGYLPKGRVLDETAPFAVPEGRATDAVLAALDSAERQVFDADGIDGIALRYGLFYGLDAGTIAPMLKKRMLPVADHDGVIPFIHHEDAAAATAAALERGVAGRAYNVADDTPTPWREYARAAASTFGAPAPLTLPSGLLRVVVPYAAELMTRMDLRVSTDLAKRELGWAPRYPDVVAGWRAGVGGAP